MIVDFRKWDRNCSVDFIYARRPWLNSLVLYETSQWSGMASFKAEVVGQGWVHYEEARASGHNIFCLLIK